MKMKRILAIVIAALTVCCLFAVNVSAEGEDNLLLYYSFDDAANLGADKSGNNHNGIVEGNLTGSAGMENGAAKFDGTSAALRVEGTGITELKLFTISAWVKLGDAEREDLVSFVSGHNWSDIGAMHCCFRNDGTFAVDVDYMWNAWLSSNTTAKDVEDGKWTLITVVFDAEEGWVWTYFNGGLVNEVGFVGGEKGVNFDNFTIGAWSNNGALGRFFNGEMDEFKLYGKAMSAEEVKALAGDHYEAPATESSEPAASTDTPVTDPADSTSAPAGSADNTSAPDTKGTETPTTSGTDDKSSGLSTGAVIGIAAAVVVVIAVVVAVVLKKKKK